MEIRLATEEDIPRMQEIFRHARQFMADKGNPNQWTEGYPAEELIREDIERMATASSVSRKDGP